VDKLVNWLEERTGIVSAWQRSAYQQIPGGARLRHTFFGVLLYLFLQEAFLGLLMAGYFSPSSTDAWASVAYFNDQVTAGWFIRGMHHHTANAMIVVGGAYLVLLIIGAGYRRPFELSWFTILGIVGLLPLAGLTGVLLPWDDQALSRMAVETSVMKGAPGGELMAKLLIGGSEFGNFTVLRLYVLHVFLLPAALLALFLLHRAQVRRHGYPLVPMKDDQPRQGIFLNQLLLDLIVLGVVVVLLVAATFKTHGAELFAPAEADSAFDARPEWYFRALNELLKYFPASLQVLPTVVLPGLATVFILGLPWIDRAAGGKLVKRLPALIGSGLIIVGFLALTGVNFGRDVRDEKHQDSMAQAHKQATRARDLARKGVLPAGGDAVYENDPKVAVKRLFKEECQTCHMLDGIGGTEAPDLTDYRSREYLSALIRNVRDPRFFGGTKHEEMDLFPEEDLSNEDLKAVVEYTYSLMGEVAGEVDAALVKKGAEVFDEECSTCHEVEKGVEGDSPNLFQNGSRQWLIDVIKDSSKPLLFGEAAQMPKFEDKLTDDQLGQLADLILEQRGKGGS
jgi:ubiquinol-cytochrome c reductase cytochrome b subunit